MVDRREYYELTEQFRELTAAKWPETQRCCRVVRDGVPQCCFQLVDGAPLTFTDREVEFLGLDVPVVRRPDGMWVVNRALWGREQWEASLHKGWLSLVLENSSHPTRPLLQDSELVGVVVIDGCNAEIGEYAAHKDRLFELWEQALVLGPKPYYAEVGREKPSWTIL